MKFKLIFALFNGIIVLSFLFVFLMPFFVLGFDNTAGFWLQNWYLVVVFLGILGILDSYFVVNWKTFSLLEREDWTGLTAHLEKQIFERKRFSDQSVRLLCNAWTVQGRPAEIQRLERLARAEKPALLARHGLVLGIPYLLANDPATIVAYFEPLAADPKAADRPWLAFDHAFGLLAAGRHAEALPVLRGLALQKKDPVVQLLALYLSEAKAAESQPDPAARAELAAARAEFRKRRGPKDFQRLVERERENLQVVIMAGFIAEASAWIFAAPVSADT